MSSVGVFLRDPNPYLREFRRKNDSLEWRMPYKMIWIWDNRAIWCETFLRMSCQLPLELNEAITSNVYLQHQNIIHELYHQFFYIIYLFIQDQSHPRNFFVQRKLIFCSYKLDKLQSRLQHFSLFSHTVWDKVVGRKILWRRT